jgi:hypothetical protein
MKMKMKIRINIDLKTRMTVTRSSILTQANNGQHKAVHSRAKYEKSIIKSDLMTSKRIRMEELQIQERYLRAQ